MLIELDETEIRRLLKEINRDASNASIVTKLKTALKSSTPCSEYTTEENLMQSFGEPCVPGDWHCQLPDGHHGPHCHTHTFKWTSD